MVIIHIFIQTEIICFYTTNPARIGLFRPHNDFPVPVYRRGRGGMLPADVGQPLLCRQKARSDLQNAVPAALRFFYFCTTIFRVSAPAFFTAGRARLACSLLIVYRASVAFLCETIQVSAKHLFFLGKQAYFPLRRRHTVLTAGKMHILGKICIYVNKYTNAERGGQNCFSRCLHSGNTFVVY